MENNTDKRLNNEADIRSNENPSNVDVEFAEEMIEKTTDKRSLAEKNKEQEIKSLKRKNRENAEYIDHVTDPYVFIENDKQNIKGDPSFYGADYPDTTDPHVFTE